MKHSRLIAAAIAVVLAAAVATSSHAQAVAATFGWGWPGYGLYGWNGPWGPCGTGVCVDNPYLRRAIRRELAQLEFLRELEERAQGAFQSYGRPLYVARDDWPPPTPDSQVQPAYRGSGAIRPEFSGAGQPRQDSAARR